MIRLTVNGTTHDLDLDPNMPLLWAIRDHIGLTGTKYGCGIAQCGSCTVYLNGAPVRSCATPLSARRRGLGHHHRGTRHPGGPGGAAGLGGAGRGPVRLLPVRADHVRRGAAREQPGAHGRGHRRGHVRQPLPLRHLCPHPRRHQARRRATGLRRRRPCRTTTGFANLSRRDFLKLGLGAGAGLTLGLHLPTPAAQKADLAAGPGIAGGAEARHGQLRAQRLRAHRHGRHRDRHRQAPGDGPGDLHRPADPGGRRARRPLGSGPGRGRPGGRQALQQPVLGTGPGHRRQHRHGQLL